MKTLIKKLVPGIVVTLAAVCGLSWLNAQNPVVSPIGAPIPPQPVQVIQAPQAYAGAQVAQPGVQYIQAQPERVTLCGACGTHLAQPQLVQVAAPAAVAYGAPGHYFPGHAVHGRPYHGGEHYHGRRDVYIPPAPIFPGFDFSRSRHHGRGCDGRGCDCR